MAYRHPLILYGTIIAISHKTVPTGYLLCNGSAVSRTTYANLFNAIGTLYGKGNGSSTFNLPNLTDRVLQGCSDTYPVGYKHDSGLPDIQGQTINAFITGGSTEASLGMLIEEYGASDANITWKYDTSYRTRNWGIKASNYNGIYGNSEIVQPPAITTLFCIKY